jgi:hypothetical protein
VSSLVEQELESSWFRGIIRELHAAGLPLSARSNAYANALKVKSGPGLLFGFSAYSSLATAQFIQVHDSAVAPASGAVPEAVFQVNSGAVATGDYIAVSYIFPCRFLQRGIYVVNSTTGPTYTAGAADTFFDAQFA